MILSAAGFRRARWPHDRPPSGRYPAIASTLIDYAAELAAKIDHATPLPRTRPDTHRANYP